LGQIGSGKTTIFNRITNSNEAVEAGGPSVTINVFLKPSAYGEVRFKALDTPGFGSAIKKIDHVAGIMAAFLEGPVNRIIIVAKLERLDLMQKNILPIIAPLTRYRDMITILVTHWDLQ
jgi:Fe2+ transport system protein B